MAARHGGTFVAARCSAVIFIVGSGIASARVSCAAADGVASSSASSRDSDGVASSRTSSASCGALRQLWEHCTSTHYIII